MATKDQEYIDSLILTIEQAEEPASVTNTMVAAALDHLNESYKELLAKNEGIQQEKSEREAADSTLASSIKEVADSEKTTKATAEAAKAVTDTAGQPGGLATLDDNGRLDETQVPAFLSDGLRAGTTARFFGIVTGTVTVEQTGATSTGLGSVVYLAKNKIFAWQAGGRYYSAWNSAAYPMVMYNDGLSVRKNKLFLYGQNAYVWSDEADDLVELAGMKADAGMFVTLNESEYAALTTKDDNTYYFIYEDE